MMCSSTPVQLRVSLPFPAPARLCGYVLRCVLCVCLTVGICPSLLVIPIAVVVCPSISLSSPDFLCPLSANTYGIDFLSFKIRDMDTNNVVFEVAKDPNAPPPQYPENFDYNQLRSIQYKFPAQFLRYETIGTTSGNRTPHGTTRATHTHTHT